VLLSQSVFASSVMAERNGTLITDGCKDQAADSSCCAATNAESPADFTVNVGGELLIGRVVVYGETEGEGALLLCCVFRFSFTCTSNVHFWQLLLLMGI